jgi:hypothetical protein
MTYQHPKIDNAPGLRWRPRQNGWEARWYARDDMVKKGFLPKTARLWAGISPTAAERQWISERCNRLQDEQAMWARGGLPQVRTWDGTLAVLIDRYQTDENSDYRDLRYHTQLGYDRNFRRLVADHGEELLADIDAPSLKRFHRDWKAATSVSTAHALIAHLRIVVRFGAAFVQEAHADCVRLRDVLSNMKFEVAKPRRTVLTAEQAEAIRAKAHELGKPSIALAQAILFDGVLRQKDVVGEWVPLREPGLSDVTNGASKWLRGIRWEELSDQLVLTHTTSKKQKEVEIDFRFAPMIMQELDWLWSQGLPGLPAKGPIVICETTGQPWYASEFRRWWRKIADAAGVPKEVWSMDSRAGAITEATKAGAPVEMIKHAAAHSNISTTERYARAGAEKAAVVMQMRAEYRARAQENKPKLLGTDFGKSLDLDPGGSRT